MNTSDLERAARALRNGNRAEQLSVAKLIEDTLPRKKTRYVLIAANYWAWLTIEPKPLEKEVASRLAERCGIKSLSRVRAIAREHKAAAEKWRDKSPLGWQAVMPCIEHFLTPKHKGRAK